MSEYGCCTLTFCVCVYDDQGIESCDDCPFYDPNFFREEAEDERADHLEQA